MKGASGLIPGGGALAMVLVAGASFAVPAFHSADQNHDGAISVSELLRVVQFYNSAGFHCQTDTEDGYAPGPGAMAPCTAHDSDYAPQDWWISLSELLRLVQFYNLGAYSQCSRLAAPTEDGYCIGNGRNVVLLLLDALREDRIGATRNGIPITPFLDTFAQHGIRFTHAIAPSTWTRPSVAGLFSGRYPGVFKATISVQPWERYVIPNSYTTLAEWLANQGYDTWFVAANNFMNAMYGYQQGFNVTHTMIVEDWPAQSVTNHVLSRIEEWQEPFFYYIHYIDPHGPYAPPAEYQAIFGPQPEITGSDAIDLAPENFLDFITDLYTVWVKHTTPQFTPLSANGIECLRYRYDADVRYLDAELERLIGAITARYPNTYFVILADHGEELMERGVCGHGITVFEELIRVPLIVAGPGVTPAVIEHPVETLGLLPALATLLNLPANAEWQGANFLRDDGNTPIVTHMLTTDASINNKAESITLGNMKYIEHSFVGVPQLYNLSTDPGELVNLASSEPEILAQMQALMFYYHQHLFDR